MSKLDAPFGKMARTLVGTLGGSGTYTRPGSGGEYNPRTGDIEGAAADTTTTVSVGDGPAAIRLFDRSLVEAGDETGIVSRLEIGSRPSPGADTLVWKGATWTVVAAESFGSGDEDAAYALLLRR